MANILKHGRGDELGEGSGDNTIICIQCGHITRLTYRPKGQFADGAYLCEPCKSANERKSAEKFLADVKRVKAHKRNRESVERSEAQMKKIKEDGKTQFDPNRAKEMKERSLWEQRRRAGRVGRKY